MNCLEHAKTFFNPCKHGTMPTGCDEIRPVQGLRPQLSTFIRTATITAFPGRCVTEYNAESDRIEQE